MTDGGLNPFVGLRPFDMADHRWFYGRNHEISALLRKVRNNRFTAVVGASGSGKSSLVRAGIMVSLVEDGWETIVVKPGSAPIAKLAAALSETTHNNISLIDDPATASSPDSLADARAYRFDALLRQSAYGLTEICRPWVAEAPRLVLVVDQFEELFRYGEEAQGAEKAAMAEESRAFVELLLTAASQAASRVHIILTMRSDFFGNCAAYNGLAEAVSASQYLVPLPRRDQIEAIIRKPIADAGGKMDELLVQRLLLEVTEQTDHLPALQHALRRLWEMAPVESGQRRLRQEDYQQIGGIAGSINFKAEQIVAELAKTHAQDSITLERIMKAVSELDEQGRATRRPQKKSALLALVAEVMTDKPSAAASINRILCALASEDISFIQLGSGDDPEVDIGHEALIRSWQRLCGEDRQFKTGWLMEEREDGRHWRDLVRREQNRQGLHIMDAWQTCRWVNQKKIGPVWASRYGDNWQAVNQLVRNSLTKNSAIALLILVAVTVALSFSIGLAWINYNEAQKNYQNMLRQEAETLRHARAGALAAAGYARGLLDQGQARLGALVALSVVPENRRRDNPRYVDEVEKILRQALVQPIEVMRLQHSDSIYSVVISPDGTQMVTGGKDGVMRLWCAQTGKLLEETNAHIDTVYGVDFSPNGRQILSGSKDGTLRLWTVLGNRLKEKFQINWQGRVYSVAFSPDGSRIAAGNWDNTVQVWDTQTGLPLSEIWHGHQDSIMSIAFSPDGKHIVSGSKDGTLRLWEAASGEIVGQTLTGHEGAVMSVAFSSDGRKIVSGGQDGSLRLWEGETLASFGQVLRGHQDAIMSVAFSPDNNFIVSGSYDKTIRRWNTYTGEQIGTPLAGHQDAVMSVAFSPEGNRIVSGGKDSMLRVWDLHVVTSMGDLLKGRGGVISSIAFSPDGRRIASATVKKSLNIWDAQTGDLIGAMTGGPMTLNYGFDTFASVAYSPNGDSIVSSWSWSGYRTPRIWDAQTRIPIGEPLKGHGGAVFSVAFSPDGRRIVSGSSDRTLRIWNAQTGDPIGEPLKGHGGAVFSVAYSPDGRVIVSGSSDRTLRIWDAQTGDPIGESLIGHEDAVSSVAFSPDGRVIVSGSSDRTLRIWDPGLFTASLRELVEKTEKLCPLSLQERQHLRLIDQLAKVAPKPLTSDQRRACGMQN